LRGDPIPLGLLLGYFFIGILVYWLFGYKNSKISHVTAN
jgi:hypothetical protein